MTKIAQVLSNKGSALHTISPKDTVRKAITVMAQHNIGALVVTDADQQYVRGIISERDYTHKVVLLERSSASTCVEDIMTRDVFTVSPSDHIDQGLKIMTDHHLRHLPVVESGKLVGLVSIGDLVKAAMRDQQQLIEQLQQYISG